MNLPIVLATLPGDTLQTEWVAPEIALLQLVTIMALVLLNGFFVASEFAIVKVRESQLAALATDGVRNAETARHVTAHLDAYLSATQLGITLASLGLGWVGEPFIAHMLHPVFLAAGITSATAITSISFAVAFAIITFLHIVLGELAPKSLAIRHPVPTTLWVSAPLKLFHTLFRPAIWALQGAANLLLKHLFRIEPVGEHELAHSEEELRLLLAESGRALVLSKVGANISARAFDLRHLTARDIATPRTDVVFLDVADSYAENLRRAKQSRHTRFPLCRGHLDEAVGLIHIKDLIAIEGEAPPSLETLKRELVIVPEMISLEKLLDTFLSQRAHLALVIDEFGGAAGIVTLDNVIEELVGDIQDEFDREEPDIQRTGPDEFEVRAKLPLHELQELAGLELESADVSTIGGYVTSLLGHLPAAGESVQIEQYRVTVTKADRRRVRRLHFRRVRP